MLDLNDIPNRPGVYLYKDKKGIIIYIGKAKSLKKRVSSYFQKKDHDPKTAVLVKTIDSFEYFTTNSEVEALILENNLIKKHQPRYNINLKDSKRYAYLKLTKDDFPRLLLARERDAKEDIFGPFTSAEKRDAIKTSLNKLFRLRTCKRLPKKECLRYHINLCSGPCISKISKDEYNKDIASVRQILKGHAKEAIDEMTDSMKHASQQQDFENALLYKNRIDSLRYLQEKQLMERKKTFNEDIINFKEKHDQIFLMLFNIDKGILTSREEFVFDKKDSWLEEFITQYYAEHDIPKELILPSKVSESIGAYLSELKGFRCTVTIPKIGEKKNLLQLVEENIQNTFFKPLEKLEKLQDALNLEKLPNHIECFDISHLSGTSTVASMVYFKNGRPEKSKYRRFKIKTVDGIDDFASMREVIFRRYNRLLKEKQELPDLIIIDVGKGQLSSALESLHILDLRLPIIGLAKRLEEIFVPHKNESLLLDKKNKALHLLQEIRDEAHRFAITYNRNLRKINS